MLSRNVVRIDNRYLPEDELSGFIRQKPASGSGFFIRPGIWIYENTLKGKQNGFKKGLRNAFGTQPVILDTNLVIQSAADIRRYLFNKGFHEPDVKHLIRYRKKTAIVFYQIQAGVPSRINKIEYSIPDTAIARLLMTDTASSLLRRNIIFDTYVLDNERDRIVKALKNAGYYDFSKSFITFIADTLLPDHRVNLSMIIQPLTIRHPDSGTLTEVQHPRFYLRNIYVLPDPPGTGTPDTVLYIRRSNRQLNIISGKTLKINPAVLSNAINHAPGEPYNLESANHTYKRLMNLSITQSVHMSYQMVNPEGIARGEKQLLDCNIRIARSPLNSLDLGTEGTNSGGRLGMGINTLFQNRNLFRGSETFRIKVNTGAEIQGNISANENPQKFLIFNTFLTGFETGLEIPRLVLPFRLSDPGIKPQTSISGGIGFESRPDYRRTVTTFSFSYYWNSSEQSRHMFAPLELNFVNISKDSAFNEYLTSLSDPQFLSQYTNHLLPMMRYSYVYNNSTPGSQRDLFYFRVTAESSGSLLYLVDHLRNANRDEEGNYTYFGVRYSQFIRTDIDIRHYWPVSRNSTFAARAAAGIGLPYGNSKSLPFEKTFWLGGANDMRGWKIRSLGPGNYTSSEINYDRTGDIMLNANLELRFPVYSFLKGAVFADAGNIWLRNENPDFEGGKLKMDQFFNQLAINTGAGIRFDFSFFILRLDWGLRIKNPALAGQWFNREDFGLKHLVWNFGIGMPF